MRGNQVHRWLRSRRKVLTTTVAVLGALAVAVPVATSAGANAAGNLAQARREARRLLTMLHVPPTAVRVTAGTGGPHGVLAAPGYDEATPNLVDAHRWWMVPGSARKVLAYVTAHLPREAKPYISITGNAALGDQIKAFALPPVPGVMRERVLAVTVVQLNSNTVGVRTDGEAVWLVPRPAWEQIPRTVTRVIFTARRATSPGAMGRVSAPQTITGAAARRLVAFINRLQVVQPGTSSCPAEFPDSVHLQFLTSGGRIVAQAVEQPTGCAYVTLTIGGRSGPPLNDYPSVTSELERIDRGRLGTGSLTPGP